jgi:hypothetical protein
MNFVLPPAVMLMVQTDFMKFCLRSLRVETVLETQGVCYNGYQQCSHLSNTLPQIMMVMVIEQTEISTSGSNKITFEA